MYIDLLHGLRDTVRTKRPEKWTMLQHTGLFGHGSKNNVTILEHLMLS
jgi:hypothetical protein